MDRGTGRVPHDHEYGAAESEYKRGIATLLTVAREDVAGQIPGMRGGFKFGEILGAAKNIELPISRLDA